MKHDPALDPEERELFRQAIGPVKPVAVTQVAIPTPKPAPIPSFSQADERQVMRDLEAWSEIDWIELETGDEIEYCRDGIQQGVWRKLKRGQFRISAVLDLHGMTIEQAHGALMAFLHHAQRQQMTCVQVIHGKGHRSTPGKPILKQCVNHWLRRRSEVLAFCSSRPVDGGTGAVYLLLRRRR